MKLETLRELRRHIRGIDAALQREIESEEMRLQEEKEREGIWRANLPIAPSPPPPPPEKPREERIIKMKVG